MLVKGWCRRQRAVIPATAASNGGLENDARGRKERTEVMPSPALDLQVYVTTNSDNSNDNTINIILVTVTMAERMLQ